MIYDHPLASVGYDALSHLVFSPVGGLPRLREDALDALELAPGVRVLELGCGTGGITRLLVSRGAEVTAVDQSEPMLRRARRRAPAARFFQSDVTSFESDDQFDRVLFAFVLHELEAPARARALAVARRALGGPSSRVAIVDYALATRGAFARALSGFIRAVEPPSALAWISGGFDGELAEGGLGATSRTSIAGGAAVVVMAAAV